MNDYCFVPYWVIQYIDSYEYSMPKFKNKFDWWYISTHYAKDNVLLEIGKIVRDYNIAMLEIYKSLNGYVDYEEKDVDFFQT